MKSLGTRTDRECRVGIGTPTGMGISHSGGALPCDVHIYEFCQILDHLLAHLKLAPQVLLVISKRRPCPSILPHNKPSEAWTSPHRPPEATVKVATRPNKRMTSLTSSNNPALLVFLRMLREARMRSCLRRRRIRP